MKIRFGVKELAQLRRAAREWDLSYSDIARKALMRVRRQRPNLSTVEVGSTYGGTELRIEPGCETDADTVRRAIVWALGQYDWSVRTPRFAAEAVEGTDYTVEGE